MAGLGSPLTLAKGWFAFTRLREKRMKIHDRLAYERKFTNFTNFFFQRCSTID